MKENFLLLNAKDKLRFLTVTEQDSRYFGCAKAPHLTLSLMLNETILTFKLNKNVPLSTCSHMKLQGSLTEGAFTVVTESLKIIFYLP